MYRSTLLALAALTTLISAQTSTVQVFIVDADPQPLVASGITVGPSGTVIAISCPTSTSASNSSDPSALNGSDSDDDSDCGFPGTFTMTYGPSTMNIALSAPDAGSGIEECTWAGTTGSATCTTSWTASGAGVEGGTTTVAPTDVVLQTISVTAGLSNLQAASASSTKGSASASATGTANAAAVTNGPALALAGGLAFAALAL